MDESSHAFVVRIWEEPRGLPGTTRLWRGSMEDVRAGTRVYFSTLLELCDQLERTTGMVRSRVPARRATDGRARRRRRPYGSGESSATD